MKYTLLLALVFTLSQVQAQTPKMTPAGRLMVQFSDAILPSAYMDQWLLTAHSWTTTAANISTGAALAGNASYLANHLRPAMFKTTFNMKGFAKAANGTKSYADAYKVLQSLEDGLSPGAFKASWRRERGNWLHDVSLLK